MRNYEVKLEIRCDRPEVATLVMHKKGVFPGSSARTAVNKALSQHFQEGRPYRRPRDRKLPTGSVLYISVMPV